MVFLQVILLIVDYIKMLLKKRFSQIAYRP